LKTVEIDSRRLIKFVFNGEVFALKIIKLYIISVMIKNHTNYSQVENI